MFLKACTSRAPWLWGTMQRYISGKTILTARVYHFADGVYIGSEFVAGVSSQDAHHRRTRGLLLNLFGLGHLAVKSRAIE